MMSKPCPKRPDLDELMRQSAARVKAMTPDERRQMFREQRRSWVRGELGIEHPEWSEEYIDRLIEESEHG